MITRIDYSSDDGQRHARANVFDVSDHEDGHVWSVDLLDHQWKGVAEWRRLPSQGTAQKICRIWVEDGEIVNDPPAKWIRRDARVEAAS